MSFKEASRVSEQEEKYFLYKGLNIDGFRIYFEQGFIAPMDPDKHWISENPSRAHRAALMYSMEMFSRSQEQRPYILAVVNPVVIKREGLIRGNSCSDLYGNYYDFYGNGIIGWDDIEVMLVNQHGLDRLKKVADVKNFPHWNVLEPKTKVIEPETRLIYDDCEFIDEVLELNRKMHF